MIEKIRKIRESKGVFTAVFTDLSKTFDCISHELLLEKLHAYGFDETLLTFMHAYLNQRLRKTKLGATFSELMSFLFGVSKGSIIGPLLFIRYICDLFILIDYLEFGSYANDSTPFVSGENFDEILGELEKHTAKISELFLHKCIKANEKKFHLFLSPFIDRALHIENFTIKSSCREVPLGVTIDSNLSFSEHVTYLCATTNRKLHALSLVFNYISLKKRPILMTSFIISQFAYCPLI